MPKLARELSAVVVRRLTAAGLHAVGGVPGLCLQVTPAGARSWILRVSIAGRVRDMGLGPYPEVSLALAREKARQAREQIRQGSDPIAERKAVRGALRTAEAKRLTFADAARRCHAVKAPSFRNETHRRDWLASLERHVFPTLGALDVAEIELPHVLQVLEPIWHQRTATATNIRQRIEVVLTWATVSGFRHGDNPARWRGNLKEVLADPNKIHRVRHHRALPWHEVPAFMADLRQRKGMAARALEFLVLTAARSGEVRFATWAEIDLDARLWTVPGERIKAGKPHKVPLSDAALTVLHSLPRFPDNPLVFAAPRGGPLSDMSVSAVTKRMGVDAVPHGFRSSFKDWARNRTNYADEVSELALAHVNNDATRAAYARDELLPQRSRLMAEWARFCHEGIAQNASVIPIGEARHQ